MTIPATEAISPNGAASAAMGPAIKARAPKLAREATNSRPNSKGRLVPPCRNSHRNTAAMANEARTTGLRPNRSESAGTPSWPRKPPKPIAEVTNPICVALRCR